MSEESDLVGSHSNSSKQRPRAHPEYKSVDFHNLQVNSNWLVSRPEAHELKARLPRRRLWNPDSDRNPNNPRCQSSSGFGSANLVSSPRAPTSAQRKISMSSISSSGSQASSIIQRYFAKDIWPWPRTAFAWVNNS